MIDDGTDHVWLDATAFEQFSDRASPTISAALADVGLSDPAHDLLPHRPGGLHYLSGGAITDLQGGHVAAGPVGRQGIAVHGRARCQPPGVELAARGHGVRPARHRSEGDRRRSRGPEPTGAMRQVLGVAPTIDLPPAAGAPSPASRRCLAAGDTHRELQRQFTRNAGVVPSRPTASPSHPVAEADLAR